MIGLITRCWNYLVASASQMLERRADSRMQVEMAIEEARRRHQLLTAQAASVLGNERELDIKVARAMGEVERLRAATGRALVLANRAAGERREPEAAEHERTANLFAAHLAAAETIASELGDARQRAAAASEAARRAVERSAYLLNTRVADASRLMTEIEAARMQERVADAFAGLDTLAPKTSVPTLEEVRSRVDRRIALAAGRAELAESGTGARMLDIERAAIENVAAEKLQEIRMRLGLPAPGSPDGEVEARGPKLGE